MKYLILIIMLVPLSLLAQKLSIDKVYLSENHREIIIISMDKNMIMEYNISSRSKNLLLNSKYSSLKLCSGLILENELNGIIIDSFNISCDSNTFSLNKFNFKSDTFSLFKDSLRFRPYFTCNNNSELIKGNMKYYFVSDTFKINYVLDYINLNRNRFSLVESTFIQNFSRKIPISPIFPFYLEYFDNLKLKKSSNSNR